MAVNRYYSAIAQDTSLTSAATNSSTTIQVGATTGFPTSYPFCLAIDYGNSLEELVDVTAAAGLTLTVTRGVNGTTAVSHAIGATVRHVISARDLTESQNHIAATGAIHGVTGAIVGTTDTQTLTNKTIAAGSNTITGITVPISTGVTGLGTGVATFLATPSSANLASAVSDETGSGSLTFATSPTLTTPILVQGTSMPTFSTNAYTLQSTDAGQFLLASNSTTAGTVNIPTDATYAFATGTQIHIQQTGTGQLTIQAATAGTTTVTSNGATSASPKIRAQYSVATIMKTAANTWTVYGDIA
jgi:hypothetical protein